MFFVRARFAAVAGLGLVSFESNSTHLVKKDGNGLPDVFARELPRVQRCTRASADFPVGRLKVTAIAFYGKLSNMFSQKRASVSVEEKRKRRPL